MERDDEDFDDESCGRPSMQLPDNPDQLVIRDLDSGNLYKVGENEPEFDYNTWPLGDFQNPDGEMDSKMISGKDDTTKPTNSKEKVLVTSSPGYFTRIYRWLFSNKNKNGDNRVTLSDKGRPRNDEKKERTQYSKLNNFKFRRKLGEGAFGRVLLAESIADGKLYAMKIMEKKGMRSSDRKQAQAERNILLAMSRAENMHPFTTGLKFAFQSEKRLYLGMDYLPGGTLKNLLQKFGYLPENWVRFFAAELVLAISHIHSLNVLYRDIKPHNVMIDGRGHLVLIDYGLSKAKVTDPTTGAMSLVGTPDYSAPEVLRTGAVRLANRKGRKSNDTKAIGYGQAADWWSLGIMIYEMLQGKPPFRGRDLRQTYKNVLFAKLSFPEFPVSNVSRSLGELQPDDVDPLMQRPGRKSVVDKIDENKKEEKISEDNSKVEDDNTSSNNGISTGSSGKKEHKGEKNEKSEKDEASDLEFSVDASSHFSSNSQMTLLGFLSREPSSRLGYAQPRNSISSTQTDNGSIKGRDSNSITPPSSNSRSSKIERNLAAIPADIKNCSFLACYTDYDWTALYSRHVNGPWIPEPDPLIVRKESRAKQIGGKKPQSNANPSPGTTGDRSTSTAGVSTDPRDPEGMALVKEACKHAEEYGEYERKQMKSMHDEIQALSSHLDIDADITNGTIDNDATSTSISTGTTTSSTSKNKGEEIKTPMKANTAVSNGVNMKINGGDAMTPTRTVTRIGDNIISPGEKFTGFEFVSSPPLNHHDSATHTPDAASKTPGDGNINNTKTPNTTINQGKPATLGQDTATTSATGQGIATNDINLEESGPDKSYFNFESDLLSARMNSVGATTKENKLMDWSFVADKNILGLEQSNMNATVTAAVVNQGQSGPAIATTDSDTNANSDVPVAVGSIDAAPTVTDGKNKNNINNHKKNKNKNKKKKGRT